MTQLDIAFAAAPTTSGPRPRAARDADDKSRARDYARNPKLKDAIERRRRTA